MSELSGDALAAALRALVATTGDAVVVVDRDGIIRFWNAGAERIFGHACGDALGASLDLIIPEQLRARHGDGFRRAVARGTTSYGERTLAVPAIRAGGERISIEFTVTLLRDDSAAVVGVAAIMRDVTERWRADVALRKRVAELERELSEVRT